MEQEGRKELSSGLARSLLGRGLVLRPQNKQKQARADHQKALGFCHQPTIAASDRGSDAVNPRRTKSLVIGVVPFDVRVRATGVLSGPFCPPGKKPRPCPPRP